MAIVFQSKRLHPLRTEVLTRRKKTITTMNGMPGKISRYETFLMAIRGSYLRRSVSVMILVGIFLNLVNQGDKIIAGHSIDFVKIALTFIVPFCVSTYVSWSSICRKSNDSAKTCSIGSHPLTKSIDE